MDEADVGGRAIGLWRAVPWDECFPALLTLPPDAAFSNARFVCARCRTRSAAATDGEGAARGVRSTGSGCGSTSASQLRSGGADEGDGAPGMAFISFQRAEIEAAKLDPSIRSFVMAGADVCGEKVSQIKPYVEEDVWLPSTLNFYRDCSRCSARRDFLHFFSAPRPPGRACGPCTQAFLSHELSRWAAAGSFGGGEARCAHGDAEHSHPRPCVTLRACLATASR